MGNTATIAAEVTAHEHLMIMRTVKGEAFLTFKLKGK